MNTPYNCQIRSRRPIDKGAILMVVLIVMIALLGLGMTGLFLTSGSIQMNSNINLRNQALVVAEAGIDRARSVLNNPSVLPPVPVLLAGSTSAADEIPSGTRCQGEARGAILVDQINNANCAVNPALAECKLLNVVYPSIDRSADLPDGGGAVARTMMGTYTVYIRQDQADCRMGNFKCEQAPQPPASVGIDGGAGIGGVGGGQVVQCDPPVGAPAPNGAVVIRSEGVASDGKTRVVLEVTMTPSQGASMAQNTPISSLCAAGVNGCDDNSSVQNGIVVNSNIAQKPPTGAGGSGPGGAGGAGGVGAGGTTTVPMTGTGGSASGTGGSVSGTGGGFGGSGYGGATSCVSMQCPRIAIMGVPGIWDPGVTASSQGNSRFESWLSNHSKGCGTGVIDVEDENNPITRAKLDPYNAIIIFDIYHSRQDRVDCIRNLSTCKARGNFYNNTRRQSVTYDVGTLRTLKNSEVQAIQDWIKDGGGISSTLSYFYEAPETGNINKILSAFNLRYRTSGNNVVSVCGNSGNGVDVSTLISSPPVNFIASKPVTKLQIVSGVPIDTSGAGPTVYAKATDTNGSTYNIGYYYETPVAGPSGRKGRVNVWADEWITYDTVWNKLANDSTYKYQPDRYWENVVNWLGQCW